MFEGATDMLRACDWSQAAASLRRVVRLRRTDAAKYRRHIWERPDPRGKAASFERDTWPQDRGAGRAYLLWRISGHTYSGPLTLSQRRFAARTSHPVSRDCVGCDEREAGRPGPDPDYQLRQHVGWTRGLPYASGLGRLVPVLRIRPLPKGAGPISSPRRTKVEFVGWWRENDKRHGQQAQ